MQILYTHSINSKFKKLDNEISIFNTKTYEYISLDEVGTDIWDFIKSPKSFDMVFNHLKDMGYIFYQIQEDESSIKIEILNEK